MSNNGMATQSMEEFLTSMMSDSPVDERLKFQLEQVTESIESQAEHEMDYLGTRANLDALAKERPWVKDFVEDYGDEAYELFKNQVFRYGLLSATDEYDVKEAVNYDDYNPSYFLKFKKRPTKYFEMFDMGLVGTVACLPIMAIIIIVAMEMGLNSLFFIAPTLAILSIMGKRALNFLLDYERSTPRAYKMACKKAIDSAKLGRKSYFWSKKELFVKIDRKKHRLQFSKNLNITFTPLEDS